MENVKWRNDIRLTETTKKAEELIVNKDSILVNDRWWHIVGITIAGDPFVSLGGTIYRLLVQVAVPGPNRIEVKVFRPDDDVYVLTPRC